MQTPINVRVMYAKDNVRRENEFELYKPALAKAGFDLIDKGSPDWGDKLGDGTYDAVVLRLAVDHHGRDRRRGRTTAPARINNLVGYSNKEVDALFDELGADHGPGRSRWSSRPRSRSCCSTTRSA